MWTETFYPFFEIYTVDITSQIDWQYEYVEENIAVF